MLSRALLLIISLALVGCGSAAVRGQSGQLGGAENGQRTPDDAEQIEAPAGVCTTDLSPTLCTDWPVRVVAHG